MGGITYLGNHVALIDKPESQTPRGAQPRTKTNKGAELDTCALFGRLLEADAYGDWLEPFTRDYGDLYAAAQLHIKSSGGSSLERDASALRSCLGDDSVSFNGTELDIAPAQERKAVVSLDDLRSRAAAVSYLTELYVLAAGLSGIKPRKQDVIERCGSNAAVYRSVLPCWFSRNLPSFFQTFLKPMPIVTSYGHNVELAIDNGDIKAKVTINPLAPANGFSQPASALLESLLALFPARRAFLRPAVEAERPSGGLASFPGTFSYVLKNPEIDGFARAITANHIGVCPWCGKPKYKARKNGALFCKTDRGKQSGHQQRYRESARKDFEDGMSCEELEAKYQAINTATIENWYASGWRA